MAHFVTISFQEKLQKPCKKFKELLPMKLNRVNQIKYSWLFPQSEILYPANISTSVQRCFWVDMTSRHRTTSNQRCNNVLYVNVEIYNVEQR